MWHVWNSGEIDQVPKLKLVSVVEAYMSNKALACMYTHEIFVVSGKSGQVRKRMSGVKTNMSWK